MSNGDFDSGYEERGSPKVTPEGNLICPFCGKEFQHVRPWQKFCSSSCRNAYWNSIHFDEREVTKQLSEGSMVIITRNQYLEYQELLNG